jgi:hypothetical protein
MEMIWEMVRKTGMLMKAMVSCHPREGTPSTLVNEWRMFVNSNYRIHEQS